MDTLLQGAVISAQRYLSNRNDVNFLIQLENRLDSINAVSQDWASANVPVDPQWTDENLMLVEWFSYCSSLLTSPEPLPVSLSSKIVAFLSSFAWYNIYARQYFQTELNLTLALSLCILRYANDQSHLSFVQQCLRLFQIITYQTVAFHESTNVVSADLLLFLLKCVCKRLETGSIDALRYSLGILNNLCTNSVAIREMVRVSDFSIELCRNLLSLLQDSSRDVVIHSLSLIMVLDDSLKDKVFNSRNLPNTFQCVFNVLLKGDQFMARHYAVDLLVRMLENSHFRQAMVVYKPLEQSMTNVCSLLVVLDAKREPFYKIYELLLKFCKADSLRQPTCCALMQAGPVDNRLISPLIAITECARSPVEQSSFPDLPTRAMKLLKNVVEEIVGSGHRLGDYVATDVLLGMIEECLKATIETGRPLLAAHKSKRIVQCLRLATAATREDAEFRTDLLEVITPALCGHLAEFQMLSNPIVSSCANILASKNGEQHVSRSDAKQIWQGVGAQILFTLIDFLRLQEQYSKKHREQYWRLLKDARVVPFLAYGITSQNKKMVRQAFQIALTMAQDEEFPENWLSELIAHNIKNFRGYNGPSGDRKVDGHVQNGGLSNGSESKSTLAHHATNGSFAGACSDQAAIDDLISAMKSNLSVHDTKLSQIMEVYERKIAHMEAKERELQEVLHARTSALQQSDRLVNHYRLNRKDVEQETTKLRAMLHEAESKYEQAMVQLSALNAEKENLRTHSNHLENALVEKDRDLEGFRDLDADNKEKLKTLTEAFETTKTELESEKDLHSVLRKHYDKMKQNFDMTYSKLTEAENELKQMKKLCKDQEAAMKTMSEITDSLKASVSEKEEETAELEKNVEKLQDALQTLDKEKKQLQSTLTESERESTRKTGLIKEQEKALQKLNEELASYAKILESMHKLSSKAVGKS